MRLNLLTRLLVMAVTTLAATACTHNNGNIGHWFGRWHLESIVASAEPQPDYHGELFWAFQRDIIGMTEVDTDSYHSAREIWGQWSANEQNTLLMLDFDHTWDHPDWETPSFTPPDILGFPAPVEGEPYPLVTLGVAEQTSSRMTLTYTNPETLITYTYKFIKR